MSIGEGECLPVCGVLRRCFVFKIAPGDYRWTVAFGYVNRVLGVGHFDPRATAGNGMVGRGDVGIIMMNGRMMSSGHCKPFQP